MWLLCTVFPCKWRWIADIGIAGLYQCKRCKTMARGRLGWHKEVRRVVSATPAPPPAARQGVFRGENILELVPYFLGGGLIWVLLMAALT